MNWFSNVCLDGEEGTGGGEGAGWLSGEGWVVVVGRFDDCLRLAISLINNSARNYLYWSPATLKIQFPNVNCFPVSFTSLATAKFRQQNGSQSAPVSYFHNKF